MILLYLSTLQFQLTHDVISLTRLLSSLRIQTHHPIQHYPINPSPFPPNRNTTSKTIWNTSPKKIHVWASKPIPIMDIFPTDPSFRWRKVDSLCVIYQSLWGQSLPILLPLLNPWSTVPTMNLKWNVKRKICSIVYYGMDPMGELDTWKMSRLKN